jgi:hypothetical protein
MILTSNDYLLQQLFTSAHWYLCYFGCRRQSIWLVRLPHHGASRPSGVLSWWWDSYRSSRNPKWRYVSNVSTDTNINIYNNSDSHIVTIFCAAIGPTTGVPQLVKSSKLRQLMQKVSFLLHTRTVSRTGVLATISTPCLPMELANRFKKSTIAMYPFQAKLKTRLRTSSNSLPW